MDGTAEEDELRSRTATHEAGHCVVAELSGLRVVESVLVTPADGSTGLQPGPPESNDLHEAHLYVAVAGYPAVGEIWGAEVERANRKADIHDLVDSDLWRALLRASKLNPAPADLVACILDREDSTRSILARPEVRDAVCHIGEVIFEHGGMSGDHVRSVLTQHGVTARAEPGPPLLAP